MFDGFTDERIDVGEVELRVRYAGSGPAVLLIHGHPRTGSTWHRVAPRLVREGFAVVCPDMRGYGQSSKAVVRADHAQQSKRTVAADMARLMRELGHPRFTAAGHDRGSDVALRLALDHAKQVERLVVMDGIPIVDTLDRCDARFAHDWYHWFFFAQPDKPERAILADPDAWYGGRPEAMGAENYDEYRAAIHDPATVTAMLEDYRAGLGVDRDDQEADRRAGRTVGCPTLITWSTDDDLEDLFGDPLRIWADWAEDLRGGHSIESGHHMAEEASGEVAASLLAFLGSVEDDVR